MARPARLLCWASPLALLPRSSALRRSHRRTSLRACATSPTPAPQSVGFLGCGNMGGAVLSRLLSAGALDPSRTYASARSAGTLERLERLGLPREHLLRGPRANAELLAAADVVVLGVKPQVAPAVLADVAHAHDPARHAVLSLVAAFSADAHGAALGCAGARVVRVIPTMAAEIGESCTAMVAGGGATDQDVAFARGLMEVCGSVEVLPSEGMLAAATACVLPTFTYLALEAIADAAVLEGLPRAAARRLAANSVRSAAALAVAREEVHPAVLRNLAESPGGITIRATRELERGGFRASIMNAVSEATKPNFD